jgi:LemA protein
MNFNTAVKAYNIALRRFPVNVIAGMFGFSSANLFEAQAGADKAPEVKF